MTTSFILCAFCLVTLDLCHHSSFLDINMKTFLRDDPEQHHLSALRGTTLLTSCFALPIPNRMSIAARSRMGRSFSLSLAKYELALMKCLSSSRFEVLFCIFFAALTFPLPTTSVHPLPALFVAGLGIASGSSSCGYTFVAAFEDTSRLWFLDILDLFFFLLKGCELFELWSLAVDVNLSLVVTLEFRGSKFVNRLSVIALCLVPT